MSVLGHTTPCLWAELKQHSHVRHDLWFHNVMSDMYPTSPICIADMHIWDLYMHVWQKQNNMLDMHITFGYAYPKQSYLADMNIVIQNAFPSPSFWQNACWTCNSHMDMQFDTPTCNMVSLTACWTCNSKNWNCMSTTWTYSWWNIWCIVSEPCETSRI